MELIKRHIEVIMKGFALCLTGLALLAAGCAQNRNSDPEIAPSRQASRLTSGSGWSVPPGQHRVTDPAAVREPPQDDRALGARSENTPKGTATPRRTVRRDANPRRDGNPPAKTMRRESDPGRDPSNPRIADRQTPATRPLPAALVTGWQKTPEPRNQPRLDAGKGEAASGNADPREVERVTVAETEAERGAKRGAVRTAPAAVVMPPVKSRRERPAFDSNPDPRPGPQSPGREKVAGLTRPERMNTGRPLRERAARADGKSHRAVKVDGPFRRPGTAAPPIRRIKPLVRAIPVLAVRKEAQPLRPVHFDFDSHKLSAEAERVLDANARWLLDHPRIMVRVEGHADERGTSEYNLTLGARRARKVRDFLISRGVSPENMLTVSFGEELPLETGSDPKSWRKNRRTEFGLINGGNLSAMTSGRKVRRSIR
ncbi:MAG: OmpA family protein [bacterium]